MLLSLCEVALLGDVRVCRDESSLVYYGLSIVVRYMFRFSVGAVKVSNDPLSGELHVDALPVPCVYWDVVLMYPVEVYGAEVPIYASELAVSDMGLPLCR